RPPAVHNMWMNHSVVTTRCGKRRRIALLDATPPRAQLCPCRASPAPPLGSRPMTPPRTRRVAPPRRVVSSLAADAVAVPVEVRAVARLPDVHRRRPGGPGLRAVLVVNGRGRRGGRVLRHE